MLTRRTFLHLALGSLLAPTALAETEFERFKREQRQGVNAMNDAWQNYQSNYQQAFTLYKERLSLVWAKPELSNQTQWVEYERGLETRRTLDFKQNEVRIAFTGTDLASVTEQRIRAEFSKTIETQLAAAYAQDPTLAVSVGSKVPSTAQTVSGIHNAQIDALLKHAKQQQQQTSKGQVLTVTIPLPSSAVPERAQQYLPLVQQQAQRWHLDPALMLAIMQAESSFNPMARSHVPAFGLMQIVPSTAGRDASKQAWGKETLLSGAQLFNPATNIELGAAYLNLLNTNYLAAITHPQSRLYCVIAAYNTGAGNVARAFVGSNSVKDAAKRINAMTPSQVYNHLRTNLRYAETRNYLAKVTDLIPTYRV